MKTIWKYPLRQISALGIAEVEMPSGAQVLSVQIQDGVCVWAMVDTDQPKVRRRFIAVGTGHDLNVSPDPLRYVGTVQAAHGILVWHIFEVGE